jgi:hypothetical protein
MTPAWDVSDELDVELLHESDAHSDLDSLANDLVEFCNIPALESIYQSGAKMRR